MSTLAQLNRILADSISQEIRPKDRIIDLLRAMFAPKLHTDVPDGFCVGQGDAAISENTLLTGGLATCTGLILTTATHNFVCHVDSKTDPNWVAESIRKFCQVGGELEEITRYNCHGQGLNEFSTRISREALDTLGLFHKCKDVPDGITGMHSVGAKRPGTPGPRLFAVFGKLEAA